MDTLSFRRLNELLEQKYWEIANQSHRIAPEARDKWDRMCESLGIRRCGGHTPRFTDEELVIVVDPYTGGNWLEMTEETAEKILTLGFP